MSNILLTDAPAIKVAKLNNMLPSGYFPSTRGCDLHTKLSPQLAQVCMTVTMVPSCFIETFGLLYLHLKQKRVKKHSVE